MSNATRDNEKQSHDTMWYGAYRILRNSRVGWGILILVMYIGSSGPMMALIGRTFLSATIVGTLLYIYVPLELLAEALGLTPMLAWYYGLF